MTDRGEPSQTREEEPRDIHVVSEQLVQREPSPLVTVTGHEYEPETDPEEDSEEDPEENPEEDPEEEEEEDPEGISLSSLGVQMYEQVYDRNIELQDRVEELERHLAERQTALEQKNSEIEELNIRLGDVEWKLVHVESEKEELEEQIVERQATLEQKDAKIQDLSSRLAEAEQRLAQSEYRRGQLIARNEIVRDELQEESAKRARAETAWLREANRADRVEYEVRLKKAKIDEMESIFHTTVDRAQDRVLRHPDVMGRRMVTRIMEQERQEAVRRGLSS